MAPKTKKDRRAEAAEKRRKQLDDLKIRNKNRSENRKIRKLRSVDKRGKIVGQKKKLSTFKAQSSYDIAKQQSGSKTGMSNLGSDYKKQEEKLSKKATEKSARINKARYPKMGTFKGEGKTTDTKTTTTKKSRTKTPTGYVRVKGRLVSTRTAHGKHAMNKLKAKKRAQELARNRK